MTRILMLAPQLPVPPQALTGTSQGTTIRNFNLLAGLSRHHEMHLAAFVRADEAGYAADLDILPLLSNYVRKTVVARQPVRGQRQRARDTVATSLPDMALRLWSDEMERRIAEHVASVHFDVIQVEGIEMAPYMLSLASRFAAGARRPRLVFDEHNAEYLLQKRAFQADGRRPRRWIAAAYSLVQWRKLISYERRACSAADRVVAVSDADRDSLRLLLSGLDVTVVPNGVDLQFYRPGVVSPPAGMGSAAMVFTGKMDYRPNVDAVLWFVDEVLPRVRAAVPEACFYAVGQRPHERLNRITRRPGVTVTGQVPDVRPYLAGAAVTVVPLSVGGGTRLKVLEAMAMGQAIVSTRLGCDGFLFEDGREVRYADEPESFAAQILALLGDRPAAAGLGQRARAYVEAHFGWDAIVPRLEALYE